MKLLMAKRQPHEVACKSLPAEEKEFATIDLEIIIGLSYYYRLVIDYETWKRLVE